VAEAPAPAAAASFLQRRIVAPITEQLRQGITPEKVALTLALGIVVGLFPILGATTFLCGLVAWRLRLNQPLIQLVNYLLYPLHLLLLLPFYRAGETLFRQPHLPIFSVRELAQRFAASPLQFFADYGMVGFYGVVVWCLLAPPTALLLYLLLRAPLRAMAGRVALRKH
jgi:uncharacterized protein (DUF2062 family)